MPQIAHFQGEKWKSSLPWEGGHPRPTFSPRSVATLPRAWSLRSLAKIVPPPQIFWLITPLILSFEKFPISDNLKVTSWGDTARILEALAWELVDGMMTNAFQINRESLLSRVLWAGLRQNNELRECLCEARNSGLTFDHNYNSCPG